MADRQQPVQVAARPVGVRRGRDDFGIGLLGIGPGRRDLGARLDNLGAGLLALGGEGRGIDHEQPRTSGDPLAFLCGDRADRAGDRGREEQAFALDIAGQLALALRPAEEIPGESRRSRQYRDDDERSCAVHCVAPSCQPPPSAFTSATVSRASAPRVSITCSSNAMRRAWASSTSE